MLFEAKLLMSTYSLLKAEVSFDKKKWPMKCGAHSNYYNAQFEIFNEVQQ